MHRLIQVHSIAIMFDSMFIKACLHNTVDWSRTIHHHHCSTLDAVGGSFVDSILWTEAGLSASHHHCSTLDAVGGSFV